MIILADLVAVRLVGLLTATFVAVRAITAHIHTVCIPHHILLPANVGLMPALPQLIPLRSPVTLASRRAPAGIRSLLPVADSPPYRLRVVAQRCALPLLAYCSYVYTFHVVAG